MVQIDPPIDCGAQLGVIREIEAWRCLKPNPDLVHEVNSLVVSSIKLREQADELTDAMGEPAFEQHVNPFNMKHYTLLHEREAVRC